MREQYQGFKGIIIAVLALALILLYIADHRRTKQFEQNQIVLQLERDKEYENEQEIEKEKKKKERKEIYESSQYKSDPNALRKIASYKIGQQGEGETRFELPDYETMTHAVLHLKARSSNGCSQKFKIRLESRNETAEEHTFFLTTEWREIYYSFDISAVKTVIFDGSTGMEIELAEVLEGETDKIGTFFSSEANNIYIEKPLVLLKGKCIEVNEKYLYTSAENKLYIYALDTMKLISVVDNVGYNVQRIVTFGNGRYAALASRENGLLFLNIENPETPYIISRYDTSELANDISIQGDYAAVASRYFGVELIDISNLSKPVQVGTAWKEGEEFQSCILKDGYLFVGVWANNLLEVFDVKDLANPVNISTVELDGHGYYMDLYEDNLYISTIQHAAEVLSGKADMNYGTGNGAEIYDVKNPAEPEWLSTVKLDGQAYGGICDISGVKVNNGYAYIYNEHYGCIVYDIRDPKAPLYVKTIKEPVMPESSLYIKYDNDNFIFPYNQEKWMNAPITDVAFGEGRLFLISPAAGIYVLDDQDCFYDVAEKSDYPYMVTAGEGQEFESESLSIENVWKTDFKVWAAQENSGLVYAACGNRGIAVLNQDLKVLYMYETGGMCKDIKIDGKRALLYSAESENGISIYQILLNGELEKLNTMKAYGDRPVSSIALGETKEHLCLAQVGVSTFSIYNVEEPEIAFVNGSYHDGGVKYYRELCSDAWNQYFFAKGSKALVSYDVSDTGYISAAKTDLNISENAGICIWKEQLLLNISGGFIFADLNEMVNGTLEIQQLPVIRAGDESYSGKIQVFEDYLICVEEQKKKVSILELKGENELRLIASTVLNGFPDLLGFADGYWLMPIKGLGLVKFKLDIGEIQNHDL